MFTVWCICLQHRVRGRLCGETTTTYNATTTQQRDTRMNDSSCRMTSIRNIACGIFRRTFLFACVVRLMYAAAVRAHVINVRVGIMETTLRVLFRSKVTVSSRIASARMCAGVGALMKEEKKNTKHASAHCRGKNIQREAPTLYKVCAA